MANTKYPKGSEWRRWDLQIHTPFSALNNGFGTNIEEYAKVLFTKAVKERIAVIGITDYFSIAGYKELVQLRADQNSFQSLLGPEIALEAQKLLLLPNVELRSSVIIRQPNGKDSRVNFHVIFADEVSVNILEEHFFRELKFTSQGTPGNPDDRLSLTLENLTDLGARLKREHEPFRAYPDIYVGMMNAVVSLEDVTDVLERQSSRFKDRYLLVVPVDEDLSQVSWNGQGHLARKVMIQRAHMVFSANNGTREFCLGRRHASPEAFISEFKTLKPCIHGSDAHSNETLFSFSPGHDLWIKADPTFLGLRQLLNEPEKRLHYGDQPAILKRVAERATKFIDYVGFVRTMKAKAGEVWFSGKVPIGLELVAIIGKKGSGKSALADVLALLGNTWADDFSFLNKDRFLAPKTGLGQMFEGHLVWRSGQEVHKLLSEPVDRAAPEAVKYIPQNYLETICTELKEREGQFDLELMDVIFSHVSKAARLGKESLPTLIEYLTNEKEQRISQLLTTLADVNATIVVLEERLTDDYKRSLEALLEKARGELKIHDQAVPLEVMEPNRDTQGKEAAEAINKELETLVAEWKELERAVEATDKNLRETSLQVAAADRLLTRIDNFERQMENFYAESATDCAALGLDAHELTRLVIERKPIVEVKSKAEKRSGQLRESLDEQVEGSLPFKLRSVKEKTATTRAKLDEPQRRYQEYLHKQAEWQKRRLHIEGSVEESQSVKGLEASLSALVNLPDQIAKARERRSHIVCEIFQAKMDLLEDYRRLYAPVQNFIDKHPLSQNQGNLQFAASIMVDGLVEGFLEMIHQGKKGTFQGDAEGRQQLLEFQAASDFSSVEGVLSFVAKVQDSLEHDRQESSGNKVRLRDQLRAKKRPEDIYNYLYGLGYLRPRFELKWQGKPIDQLSPGERGSLLLIFYLLIDQRDEPLIIDQPEENLDNETIATVLVPAITYAKARRQIIMVTHNPNLAVVCDADQIIYANLDKTAGNQIKYISGAIEAPEMAQFIVDVLEGTKPAFDLRDAKYEILERR